MSDPNTDKLLAKYSASLSENARLRERCAHLARRNEQLELKVEQQKFLLSSYEKLENPKKGGA